MDNSTTEINVTDAAKVLASRHSLVSLLAVPFHICHILLIIMKRKLHQNVYILLINLSLSDLFLIMVNTLRFAIDFKIQTAADIFITSSVLFTLGITVDRYIKVELDYAIMLFSQKDAWREQ